MIYIMHYQEKLILNNMKLDKKAILEYQKNRDPYLFIDKATSVIPGESADGEKFLSQDEWFFKVHWPEDPNMPGMLQVEALVQLCALSVLTLPNNKGKIVYLLSATDLKFKKKITPNKNLVMKTKLLTWKRGIGTCKGTTYVDNEVACEASFNILLKDDLIKYKIK